MPHGRSRCVLQKSKLKEAFAQPSLCDPRPRYIQAQGPSPAVPRARHFAGGRGSADSALAAPRSSPSIELPRIDVNESITAGRGLVAEFGAHKKPAANVATVIKYVERTTDNLQNAVFSKAEAGSDPTYLTQLRRASKSWSSGYDWVKPFARTSDPAMVKHARQIIDGIYADGVRFARFATADRWIAAEQRVKTIADEKLSVAFEALGEAAGITAPRGASSKSGVPAAFDTWKAAVRAYITQVVANEALALLVNPSDTAVSELCAQLLRPISSIETTRAASAPKPGASAADDKKAAKKDAEAKSKDGASEEKAEPSPGVDATAATQAGAPSL
jgi:hypothetical protein